MRVLTSYRKKQKGESWHEKFNGCNSCGSDKKHSKEMWCRGRDIECYNCGVNNNIKALKKKKGEKRLCAGLA